MEKSVDDYLIEDRSHLPPDPPSTTVRGNSFLLVPREDGRVDLFIAIDDHDPHARILADGSLAKFLLSGFATETKA